MYTKYLTSAILLAGLSTAAPTPNGSRCSSKSKSITAKYDDITTLPLGLPGDLTNVPTPYLGLDYSSSFHVANSASPESRAAPHSSPNVIFFNVVDTTLTPATISLPTSTTTSTSWKRNSPKTYTEQSFDFESFYFACVVNTAGGLNLATACTANVSGTTISGKSVSYNFSYKPTAGLLAVSKQTKVTLPSSFKGLKNVTFKLTSGVTGAVIVPSFDDLKYDLRWIECSS